MRTVCGLARGVQRLIGRARRPVPTSPPVRLLAGGRSPLVADRLGAQRRGGAVLDQVDGTTCGSAVLVALAAWADHTELERLDGAVEAAAGARAAAEFTTGITVGFGARFDARQLQVHRESTHFWPAALGTSPWGMVAWLRKYAPAAGPYRVRLVDDTSATDLADALTTAGAALAAGRPVPLLVGTFVPRHYVMAVGAGSAGWRVYEPGSAEVRALDLAELKAHRTAPLLGFDRLHAILQPT